MSRRFDRNNRRLLSNSCISNWFNWGRIEKRRLRRARRAHMEKTEGTLVLTVQCGAPKWKGPFFEVTAIIAGRAERKRTFKRIRIMIGIFWRWTEENSKNWQRMIWWSNTKKGTHSSAAECRACTASDVHVS